MKNHSVIFIDNHWSDDYSGKKRYPNSSIGCIVNYFTVPPYVLPKRIALAFTPPILGDSSRRVYVDFVGPCLAILTLAGILHYGHAYKVQSAALNVSPTEVLLYYCASLPLITFFLAKLGRAALGFTEIAALLGYGLYGHILTLAVSQLFDHERSNTVFFVNLLIFGGLSGLRIALVMLASIPRPASRLLICSIATTAHLMFVVFIHFAYMHSTFVYGSGTVVRQRL
uniref:Uncharacterized protein n=1 Tax=Cuerna arida TaxID=1464854 RepID=A0A1B6GMR6_9HEMI